MSEDAAWKIPYTKQGLRDKIIVCQAEFEEKVKSIIALLKETHLRITLHMKDLLEIYQVLICAESIASIELFIRFLQTSEQ